jgi:hypothetical protein
VTTGLGCSTCQWLMKFLTRRVTVTLCHRDKHRTVLPTMLLFKFEQAAELEDSQWVRTKPQPAQAANGATMVGSNVRSLDTPGHEGSGNARPAGSTRLHGNLHRRESRRGTRAPGSPARDACLCPSTHSTGTLYLRFNVVRGSLAVLLVVSRSSRDKRMPSRLGIEGALPGL